MRMEQCVVLWLFLLVVVLCVGLVVLLLSEWLGRKVIPPMASDRPPENDFEMHSDPFGEDERDRD
jgi:C4-dicarboxylate transporter